MKAQALPGRRCGDSSRPQADRLWRQHQFHRLRLQRYGRGERPATAPTQPSSASAWSPTQARSTTSPSTRLRTGCQRLPPTVALASSNVQTQDASYAANMAQFTNKNDVVMTGSAFPRDRRHGRGRRRFARHQVHRCRPVLSTRTRSPPRTSPASSTPRDQAGYGAGYLAGLMTKTNKIGQVLGLEIPPVRSSPRATRRPAPRYNPAVQVTGVLPAGMTTPSTTRRGAPPRLRSSSIGSGFIFGAGGNTGNGCAQEVAKATRRRRHDLLHRCRHRPVGHRSGCSEVPHHLRRQGADQRRHRHHRNCQEG